MKNMHSQESIEVDQYFYGNSSSFIYLHVLLRMPFCTHMGTQLSGQAEIFVLAWTPYHDRRTKTSLRLHRPAPRPQRKVVMENLLFISQGHPRLFFLMNSEQGRL